MRQSNKYAAWFYFLDGAEAVTRSKDKPFHSRRVSNFTKLIYWYLRDGDLFPVTDGPAFPDRTFVYEPLGTAKLPSGETKLRKSHIKIVSSCELDTIWNSSNCNRNTRPVCSYKKVQRIRNILLLIFIRLLIRVLTTNVLKHNVLAEALGSKAATKSHTFILPS